MKYSWPVPSQCCRSITLWIWKLQKIIFPYESKLARTVAGGGRSLAPPSPLLPPLTTAVIATTKTSPARPLLPLDGRKCQKGMENQSLVQKPWAAVAATQPGPISLPVPTSTHVPAASPTPHIHSCCLHGTTSSHSPWEGHLAWGAFMPCRPLVGIKFVLASASFS